jgi:DNA-binding transcriptional LysR family regulator
VHASRPEARLAAIPWTAVADLPLCLLTGDMQNRRIINQHLTEAGAVARARVESNSTIALISHVMSGRWVSIVAETVSDLHTGSTGLRAIPIHDPEAQHTVGLIAAFREPHTPVLAALIDEARRIART